MQRMRRQVRIDARFRGPPNSANGGYACGLLAEGIEGVATAQLRLPPPLERDMTFESDGNVSRLSEGDSIVGEATSDVLHLHLPKPPTREQAEQAVQHFTGFETHPFPSCYVCGPDREPGDGMQVFPGRVPGTDLVASPWTPDETLRDDNGQIDRRHVWAALDCPSYFGITSGPLAVLASLTAEITRAPEIGEPLIAFAWFIGSEGRKHRSASAIATAAGETVGKAAALWIEPRGGITT